MLRIIGVPVSVAVTALVFTSHAQESPSQPVRSPTSQQAAEQTARKDQQSSQQQRNQQSTFQPGQITDSQLKRTVTDVNKASSFIGMAVKNTQNESLGKVHDLVFDPESGKISYAVISVGGMLGVGDKLIAVPVTFIKPQPGQKHLVINMDKNQVQSAPGLAQNNWPPLDATGLGAPAGSESATSGAASENQSAISTESSSRPQSSPSSQSEDSKSGTSPSAGSNSDSSAASPPATAEPDSSTSKSDSDRRKDQ